MAPIKVSTTIEIDAPPDVVRSKFLDFSTIHLYHRPTGFIKSLSPTDGMELKPGDGMKNCLGGMNVTPTVVANNETTFAWQGGWPFSWFSLLGGTHTFEFLPSASSTPSSPKTHLVQSEEFTGVLAWIMGLAFARKMTREGFEGLNEDLKAWVEGAS